MVSITSPAFEADWRSSVTDMLVYMEVTLYVTSQVSGFTNRLHVNVLLHLFELLKFSIIIVEIKNFRRNECESNMA